MGKQCENYEVLIIFLIILTFSQQLLKISVLLWRIGQSTRQQARIHWFATISKKPLNQEQKSQWIKILKNSRVYWMTKLTKFSRNSIQLVKILKSTILNWFFLSSDFHGAADINKAGTEQQRLSIWAYSGLQNHFAFNHPWGKTLNSPFNDFDDFSIN